MKIRTSFVSNSSSSSFIISNNESKEIVKQLLMDNGYDYYELDGVLYTSFIGDCSDLYSEIYNLTIDDTIDGSHDFPYDEDNFFEFEGDLGSQSVYIPKSKCKDKLEVENILKDKLYNFIKLWKLEYPMCNEREIIDLCNNNEILYELVSNIYNILGYNEE